MGGGQVIEVTSPVCPSCRLVYSPASLHVCAGSASSVHPMPSPYVDPVNHPPHYRWLPVEVIEITERLNFCLGNVIKYVLRADHKGKPVEDLKKARWYLDREIARREAAGE